MPYNDDDDYNRPYTRPRRTHNLNQHTPGNEERAMEAKLVVMGNTGVGKTSLVTRYTEDKFSARTTATTGALFVSHKTDFEGFQVKLQIWDTAG
jgi:GTPase SAR1 family protein